MYSINQLLCKQITVGLFLTNTGSSGWGISWYLNSLLIPNVTMYRGTTYTFTVEGGSDPSNQARYHPFYITSSDRGGYLAKSTAERQVHISYTMFQCIQIWFCVQIVCVVETVKLEYN